MTSLELLLRVSLARAELLRLARVIDPSNARVLAYAANVVALVEPHTLLIVQPSAKVG